MYIERHYNQDISVAQLANWCNLDRSYFGKIFRDTVLVTPQDTSSAIGSISPVIF